jgi:hypothetical protein
MRVSGRGAETFCALLACLKLFAGNPPLQGARFLIRAFQPELDVEVFAPLLVLSEGLAECTRIRCPFLHLLFQSADHRVVVRDRKFDRFEPLAIAASC